MMFWPLDGWKSFLRDRILLYEVCEVCRTFPGAGTPTQYLGLDREFSEHICVEIDKGLAQFVRWYDARFEATEKSGKYKTRPKYRTLGAVLGIEEEERRGGMDGGQLTDYSKAYLQATIEARKKGLPVPDITTWIAEQKSKS